MTKIDIMTAIRTSGLSENDLLAINRDLINFIKHKRTMKCAVAASQFAVGDAVQWTGRRHPRGIEGTLIKINRKNGKVKVGHSTWTVPMSILEHVAA